MTFWSDFEYSVVSLVVITRSDCSLSYDEYLTMAEFLWHQNGVRAASPEPPAKADHMTGDR